MSKKVAASLLLLSGTVSLAASGQQVAGRYDPVLEASQAETGFVNAGEVKLHYEELGQGPAVVLLHGGFLDLRMWDPQFAIFSKGYRVIRYDARNHGESRGVPGQFAHYEDLAALLDGLNIEQAALVGLSLGGRTAIDFALAYPERVSALILASPGAGGADFESEALQENSRQMNQAFSDGDLARAVEYFQRSWTDGLHRSPADVDPEVRETVRKMASNTTENWKLECVSHDLEPPAIGRLAEIDAPTLVVVGDLDMPGILDIAAAVEENIEGSEVIMMSGVAHMVNLERPREFNEHVLGFLARQLVSAFD